MELGVLAFEIADVLRGLLVPLHNIDEGVRIDDHEPVSTVSRSRRSRVPSSRFRIASRISFASSSERIPARSTSDRTPANRWTVSERFSRTLATLEAMVRLLGEGTSNWIEPPFPRQVILLRHHSRLDEHLNLVAVALERLDERRDVLVATCL